MVDVKNIVIIGAGLMGHNAGQIFLMGGYNVTLVDIKDEFVDNGVAKIDEGLKKLEAKGINIAELDALSPDNIIIFATGPGTAVPGFPSSGRHHVMTLKAPLTGSIGSSNSGSGHAQTGFSVKSKP